jgi:hypothetical protein
MPQPIGDVLAVFRVEPRSFGGAVFPLQGMVAIRAGANHAIGSFRAAFSPVLLKRTSMRHFGPTPRG